MAQAQVKPTYATDADFKKILTDAGDKPVLVDFYADWCGPCQIVAPVMDKLADSYADKAMIVKLNVDENPETSRHFGVMSIPTVMVFKNGELSKIGERDNKQVGALNEQGYRDMIDAAM